MKTKKKLSGKTTTTCFACGATMAARLTQKVTVLRLNRKVDMCVARKACQKRKADSELERRMAAVPGRPGTVAWLIASLKKFPKDMAVVIGSTDSAYYDIDSLGQERVELGEIVDDPDTEKSVCIEVIY